MRPLRLIAFDTEDLAVLSAHLQDAVLRVADMTYLPGEKRFALVLNRFDWEGAQDAARRDRDAAFERRRTGVHFDRVLAVRTQRIDRAERDRVLELLAVRFEASAAPAGTIELAFAGGATLRLEVECIEAAMRDLGGAWETGSRPAHPAADSG